MKFSKYILLLFSALTMTMSSAHAVSVGGQEFERALSVFTRHDLGFWSWEDKFFTFRGNDNYVKSNRIHTVLDNETGLTNDTFREVLFMGTSVDDDGPLEAATIELLGNRSEVLLSATYVSDGMLSTVRQRRRAGQLDVKGIFSVTGGSMFDSGIFANTIYVDVAFDNVWQNKYSDLKTDRGTYTFFNALGSSTPPATPPAEVPEPMTMALLLSGLACGARFRRKP